MKKYLLSLGIALASFSFVMAQDTLNCNFTFSDTVKYIMSKTGMDYSNQNSSLSLISVSNVNDNGSYGYAGYGQAFSVSSPISVKGVAIYGLIYSGSPDSIWVNVYNMNAGAVDTLIDSVKVPLSYQPGYNGTDFMYPLQTVAVFNSTLFLNSDYMVAVENHSNKDFYVTRTDTAYGNNEGLAYTYYEGVTDPQYDGWYNMLSFGPNWDFDIVLEPIVEYSCNSQIIISTDSLCNGDSIQVSINTVMADTSVFYDSIYNQDYNAFADSFAVNSMINFDSVYILDTSYAYSTGGDYMINFKLSGAYPYWSNPQVVLGCSYSVYQSNLIPSVANLDTMCLNETAVLYPGSFDSYSWNTGQFTDSIQIGPFTQSDSLTYSVYVTDGVCTGTYSYPVFVDNCMGIDELTNSIAVYPTITTDVINIQGEGLIGKSIEIVNMMGQKMISHKLLNSSTTIDLSSYQSGFYIVKINGDQMNFIKKIQIVK